MRVLLVGVSVAVVALALVSCGKDTSPSGSAVSFTFTPNPVSAVSSPSCLTGTTRNWFWIITARNTGSAAFVATSFTTTTNVPGSPPLVTQGTVSDFASVFGTTTIAAGATVPSVGNVCAGLTSVPSGEVTISYVVRGQSGESVTTPILRLLP